MRAFSRGLRSLYAECAVSETERTTGFCQIREAVRQDAAVYCSKVLPMVAGVVTNLSQYFDNYLSLEFEDWQECLEDIIKEVEHYEVACDILSLLHRKLMTSLKRRKDEAEVFMAELENVSAELKQKVSELEEAARQKEEAANTWSLWGHILAAFTLGISEAVTVPVALGLKAEARQELATAVALQANVDIEAEAAGLTKRELIPAVSQFLEGLSVWQTFFAVTKVELEKMRRNGNSVLDGGKQKRFFLIMKNNGRKIDVACQRLLGCIGEVSNS
jgi:hypothetical protein